MLWKAVWHMLPKARSMHDVQTRGSTVSKGTTRRALTTQAVSNPRPCCRLRLQGTKATELFKLNRGHTYSMTKSQFAVASVEAVTLERPLQSFHLPLSPTRLHNVKLEGHVSCVWVQADCMLEAVDVAVATDAGEPVPHHLWCWRQPQRLHLHCKQRLESQAPEAALKYICNVPADAVRV